MQLKITTDYAIRSVLYLALKNGTATSSEIGEAISIPAGYAMKVMALLRAAGLADSQRGGQSGGYCLLKKPEEITLRDVIIAVEKTIRINRCLEDDKYCSRGGVEQNCPVHAYYTGLQRMIEDYLSAATIQDIIDGAAGEKAGEGAAVRG